MACRCISLRAIELDCEQVQAANSLAAQRPSTYMTAAQAALAALAQVQSKRRDDAILRAVQAVAASGAAATADRFAQLQRSLDALDKAALLRDLDSARASVAQQMHQAEAGLRQLTEEADQLRANHAELSSYAATGLARLNALTKGMINRSPPLPCTQVTVPSPPSETAQRALSFGTKSIFPFVPPSDLTRFVLVGCVGQTDTG
jgi:hypothetical protein